MWGSNALHWWWVEGFARQLQDLRGRGTRRAPCWLGGEFESSSFFLFRLGDGGKKEDTNRDVEAFYLAYVTLLRLLGVLVSYVEQTGGFRA